MMSTPTHFGFLIGGHPVVLVSDGNGDVERMLPSFQPFCANVLPGETVMEMRLCDDSFMSEPVLEIGQFDCSGCIHGVHQTADGGYLFHLRDVDGSLCCIMQSAPDFSTCWVSLHGGTELQKSFGLNNAMMLAYAFSTADKQTLLVHSSVIRCSGKAYMMTAPSGTGKSTHTRLWYDNIPGCDLMNDDNPIVRIVDGCALTYGSPWSGKTPCYKNTQAPVGAIVRIKQAQKNSIRRLYPVESLAVLLPAMSCMKWDKRVYGGVCDTVSRLIGLCGIYELGCLPNAEAALLCHDSVAI